VPAKPNLVPNPQKKSPHAGLYFFLKLMGRTTCRLPHSLLEKIDASFIISQNLTILVVEKMRLLFFQPKNLFSIHFLTYNTKKLEHCLTNPWPSKKQKKCHKTQNQHETKNLSLLISIFLGIFKVKKKNRPLFFLGILTPLII